MCGRYYIDEDPDDELLEIIEALNRKPVPDNLKSKGEIFPSDVVPVLANSRHGTVATFAMRWGYAFPNDRPIINARSETAAAKPLFSDGMARRRCLIPASCYFEWSRGEGKRQKYAIRPEEKGITYLAGVYHLEKYGPITVPAFAVLTRAAAPGIAFIHPRMPVILPKEVHADWLDARNDANDVLCAALEDMRCQIAP